MHFLTRPVQGPGVASFCLLWGVGFLQRQLLGCRPHPGSPKEGPAWRSGNTWVPDEPHCTGLPITAELSRSGQNPRGPLSACSSLCLLIQLTTDVLLAPCMTSQVCLGGGPSPGRHGLQGKPDTRPQGQPVPLAWDWPEPGHRHRLRHGPRDSREVFRGTRGGMSPRKDGYAPWGRGTGAES